MLSKKLTLSLASLLVLIAFGIAFCVPVRNRTRQNCS